MQGNNPEEVAPLFVKEEHNTVIKLDPTVDSSTLGSDVSETGAVQIETIKKIEIPPLNKERKGIKISFKSTRRSKFTGKLHKQYNNIEQILVCTNATPIRHCGDFGYSCCYCENQYQDAADLKQHTIDNHKGIENACFNNKRGLYGLLVKLDITRLRCKLCEGSIENWDDIFTHLNTLHNRVIYTDVKNQIVPFKFESAMLQCFVCRGEFTKFKALVTHMATHYRNFVCEFCDAGSVSQKQLRLHVRNYHNGTFKCDECDKVFDTWNKKKFHVRYYHTKQSLVYKCSFCNEMFSSYRQKLAHCKDAHGVYTEIKCNACEQIFWNQQSLRVHTQRDHMVERRMKCTLCEKAFYSTTNLKHHMVMHTGERTYQCDICLKSYARKSTIRQHMRIHIDDRRFKCEHCGQAFVQKCAWRGHMRSRHGEIV